MKSATAIPTEFAPAEREDHRSVLEDANILRSTAALTHITDTVPCGVLILNSDRQAVFANRVLLEVLDAPSEQTILGQRPGEILGCVNADRCEGGCGTSRFCSACGAVKAILHSQTQKTDSIDECRIVTRDGPTYEFRVSTSSYTLAGRNFVIFSVIDTRDAKRRRLLEQTFLHDTNNVLSVVQFSSEVIKVSNDPTVTADHARRLALASDQLIREIASHKRLLAAENGDLALNINTVNTSELVTGVIELASNGHPGLAEVVLVESDFADLDFRTDKALLFRILENMVRNALEAIEPEEEITISCRTEDNRVIFSVHNSGHIPERDQYQMFQCSFSTKGSGRGIGTHSMKLYGETYLGGDVWFESTEEDGTTFYISVPRNA